MRLQPDLVRADQHVGRLLDAPHIQHDLLVAFLDRLRSADAHHLRPITAAKGGHARAFGIAAAAPAVAEAGRRSSVGEQEAGEELGDGGFEGREAGADDADVDFEEGPAVGDGLVVWRVAGWVSYLRNDRMGQRDVGPYIECLRKLWPVPRRSCAPPCRP